MCGAKWVHKPLDAWSHVTYDGTMTTTRTCPECGATFPGARNRIFCTAAHREQFYNLMSKRGRVCLPLLSTWARGRRKSCETVTFALRELTTLEAQWGREDRACGRNPALLVDAKIASNWRAVDLQA